MKTLFSRPKPLAPGGPALAMTRRVVEVQQEIPQLPRKRLFGRDRASAEAELTRLKEEMIALLAAGEMLTARANTRRCEEQLRAARAHEVEQREGLTIGRASTRDATRAAQQVERLEAQLRAAQEAEFKALLASEVELTPEQADALMLLPGGDDDLGLIACIANLRPVMDTLGELMSAARDGASINRYYQYRVVLLEALLTVQERVATRIHETYIPNIGRHAERVQDLRSQTDLLLRGPIEEARRRTLLANQSAQDTAIKAISLAKGRLLAKARRLANAIKKTRADIEVARNTAETARVTQDLAFLLRDTEKLFDELTSLSIPEALPFEGDAIRHELLRLSGRLMDSDFGFGFDLHGAAAARSASPGN